ncbi:MAG TPA: arylesterase [Rubricoccaceae bacterium]|jgi:acyl-CoA thioesterase-1
MRSLLLMLPFLAAGCTDAPAPPPASTESGSTASTTAATAAASPPRSDAEGDSVVVLFFGDSLTAGYGLANPAREAYPALVGASLAEAGVPARVVNAGSSGETSAGGLRRVDWVLSRTTPDVFVLALGANDGLRGQSVEAMEANLTAILNKVKVSAPNARLVVAGVAALPNYGAQYGEQFRAVFPRVAEAAGADLVPFLLDRVAGVRRLNQADQVHPTAEGQRILAETVGRVVLPVVREAAAAKAS